MNFPVEDGQLLTQGEILCREGCSGDDQAPDEQKESGTPKELFSLSDIGANPGAGYAVTRDGQRFLFVTSVEETNVTPFTVVLNWMAEAPK